ncbi:MAG TPA: hypothetical protein VGL95_02575 [Acetobacteraceae bacterium]
MPRSHSGAAAGLVLRGVCPTAARAGLHPAQEQRTVLVHGVLRGAEPIVAGRCEPRAAASGHEVFPPPGHASGLGGGLMAKRAAAIVSQRTEPVTFIAIFL